VTLKVLTLNVWNRGGPWELRAKRIREWIDQLDPDLIGFQEVLRGDGVDLAADLVGSRGYRTEFACAIEFWEDRTLLFGNSIASRWPIRDHDVLSLPEDGSGERRIALGATIDSPYGPIGFTSTHLNWKLHHGAVRERQVIALCDWVRGRRPREGFPPILVGDFNAEPDSAEVRYVCGLQSLEGRSVHFRDAWRHAGDGDYGLTWSNRNSYASPWFEPERRIDYIFVGSPQAPSGIGNVESCRVVCNDAVDGVWPSDHFGVFAELRTEPLPKEPRGA
jgi:endonuclease/exonuclease/phosphatase family metal-dependent hydrolase